MHFIFFVCNQYFIFISLFRNDVWFDDLEIDMVEGELVAKQSVMQTTEQIRKDYKKLLITGPDMM